MIGANEGDGRERLFGLRPLGGRTQGSFLNIKGKDPAAGRDCLGQIQNIVSVAGGGIDYLCA